MNAKLNILVSGTSIAGPAAAYWLHRIGHTVTLIERSDQLRRAGQNIDVRGTGREVLRLMGLDRELLGRNTGEVGTRFVDDDDRTLWEIPAGTSDSDGPTGQAEILRGELSDILVSALPDDVSLRFGQRITGFAQDRTGVDITINDDVEKRYDLVVVAEGTRSSTRRMVFGDVPTRPLGLYTAFGTIPRGEDDNRYWNWYNAIRGRSVTVRPDNMGTTRVALSFLSPSKGYEGLSINEQKKLLIDMYSDVGWKVPRILDGIANTDELYVDNLAQVFAPTYGKGRVVLLGDAAWCATPLSGLGATLALTGAYVLAGELAWNSTIDAALHHYQAQMKVFVDKAQKLPPGGPRLAHPMTPWGLAAFRTVLRIAGSRPVQAVGAKLPSRPSKADELPHYPELRA
ncbi:FAD-dependent monooxygenase [Mycolicibacterium sp. BiH015]|uniref:FAD-dependent monooxygenase n=1 Tax=Mycolicibacterium sp. BiH015 TaxID=3018808 RepID=UPI0022E436A1|nr:FAD-dependent monooxygenase [Mycolicibacterium sp. BiH015]MDA2890636.1 FAD-dependent monooxygenase [Mycolicibacterium sp. BiH015]